MPPLFGRFGTTAAQRYALLGNLALPGHLANSHQLAQGANAHAFLRDFLASTRRSSPSNSCVHLGVYLGELVVVAPPLPPGPLPEAGHAPLPVSSDTVPGADVVKALPQFAIHASQALVEFQALLKFSCTLRGHRIFSLRAGEPDAVPSVEYTSLVGRLFAGGPAVL